MPKPIHCSLLPYLSILEDINDIVDHKPLSVDDLLAHYYVKPSGARYMLYKRPHKKHVCLFPNKTNYVDFAAYKVIGRYTVNNLWLSCTEPDYSGIN